jgi:hypothetical protein
VLKASAEGIALANCTVQGTSVHGVPIVNKTPYVSRLFKNTGIGTESLPVLWVPLAEISDVKVLEQPPKDFVAPTIEISTANTQPVGVDIDFNAAAKTDENAAPAQAVVESSATP